MQHPTIGELRMPNVPMKLSGTPAEVKLPPPLLGEHTDAVLRELLGYEEDRLAQLHATGAILKVHPRHEARRSPCTTYTCIVRG